MTLETAPPPTPTPRQETHHALDELRAALDMRGITLPSLDLDPVTLAAIHNGAPYRRPRIERGRVNLGTARELAQALATGDAR